MTDLRNLDLDSIVNFERKSVEIYGEDQEKPRVGEGLNKPATITFYDFGLSSKPDVFHKQVEKIKSWVKTSGGEIVKIDTEKDEVLIKVSHF